MIKLENITKEYITDAGKVKALNGINLSIPDGEIIAITGQSGSGKSSLMNVIGCLDTPTSGKYFIDYNNIRLKIITPTIDEQFEAENVYINSF